MLLRPLLPSPSSLPVSSFSFSLFVFVLLGFSLPQSSSLDESLLVKCLSSYSCLIHIHFLFFPFSFSFLFFAFRGFASSPSDHRCFIVHYPLSRKGGHELCSGSLPPFFACTQLCCAAHTEQPSLLSPPPPLLSPCERPSLPFFGLYPLTSSLQDLLPSITETTALSGSLAALFQLPFVSRPLLLQASPQRRKTGYTPTHARTVGAHRLIQREGPQQAKPNWSSSSSSFPLLLRKTLAPRLIVFNVRSPVPFSHNHREEGWVCVSRIRL